MTEPLRASEQIPFAIRLFARWPDLDFNQHMRNAAYLGASDDCRLRFLAERGSGLDVLHRLRIGPVVLEDRIVYRKEIALLETFEVDLAVVALTDDARRMKLRNTFRRDRDGAHVATVESVVIWLDLAARRPVVPPGDLAAPWFTLVRTPDFRWYDDTERESHGSA